MTRNLVQFGHGGGVKQAYIFGEDGKFRAIRYFDGGGKVPAEEGTGIDYSVSGNLITYKGGGYVGSWQDEYSISGGKLTLKTVRVSDGNPDFEGVIYVFEDKEKL